MYFELDPSNRLVEIETLPGTTDIVSLGIGPVPEGLQRSRFLAVGDKDNKVRIYSLNPNGKCFFILSSIFFNIFFSKILFDLFF